MSGTAARPSLALGILALLAAIKLGLHLIAIHQYGYFRDELYYLACTDHLAWGYVDHPPLSIGVLAGIRAILGDSLFAIRIVPAISGMAVVFLTGAITRRLGGGAVAQGLAGLAALFSPVLLALDHFYSMNALELALWPLAVWALLHALDAGARPGWWLALGAVLGLALLNKLSALWLGGGIFVALVLTPYRRTLRQPWPWVAAALAGAIFVPHVLWQIREGWPTLEFMHNATSEKMAETGPIAFVLNQGLVMSPGIALISLVGLGFGFAPRTSPPARLLVWIFVSILILLLVERHSRASYLSAAYPILFATAGVAVERLSEAGSRRWLRPLAIALVVLLAAPLIPFALPVLPVRTFVGYQAALGVAPPSEERNEMGVLPQHYADMFGWEAITQLVAKAYQRLTPDERKRCRVFGQNYGEAGAIDVLGQKLGLPRAMSGHNSYWLWGRDEPKPDILIIIGGDPADNARFFEEIEIVGQTSSPWAMPYERGLDVSIARKPKVDLNRVWPELKHYI